MRPHLFRLLIRYMLTHCSVSILLRFLRSGVRVWAFDSHDLSVGIVCVWDVGRGHE